jgi:hypothetical protein
MLAALTSLEDLVSEGTLNAQTHTQVHFPEEDLHWDPDNG